MMATPPDELPKPSFYQQWVHGGWANRRRQIYGALKRTGQTKARCWGFIECCGPATVEERDFENGIRKDYRIRSSRCHDRFCVPCSCIRTNDVQRALHDRASKIAKPSLITLTLKSQPKEPLAQKIAELKKSFKILRELNIWAGACRGGAAFLEVTRGEKGDRWHVHYHIIADADFMEQGRLSAAWKSITSGSSIVWIERPKSGDGIGYAAKYGSKGVDPSIADTPDLLDEIVLAMKGVRAAFCFGDWYGTSFASHIEEERLDESETSSPQWRTVATLATAAAAALAGDAYFINALRLTPFGRAVARDATGPPLP